MRLTERDLQTRLTLEAILMWRNERGQNMCNLHNNKYSSCASLPLSRYRNRIWTCKSPTYHRSWHEWEGADDEMYARSYWARKHNPGTPRNCRRPQWYGKPASSCVMPQASQQKTDSFGRRVNGCWWSDVCSMVSGKEAHPLSRQNAQLEQDYLKDAFDWPQASHGA